MMERPLVTLAVVLGCLALPAPLFAHAAIERQIADLTVLIDARPQDASLYLRRGELHRARGDWGAAARDYRRARRIDPALDTVDLCVGRMLLEARRPGRAIASLDRFLLKHPDHADALATRAHALARQGRNLDAARDFTRAIAYSRPPLTADPDLYLERARVLSGADPPRLDEAIRGLDEGMAALGPLVSLGFYAIDLEVRLERFDAALARLGRLATLSPRKESYLVRRGGILEAASRPGEAIRAYQEALAAIAALPRGRRAASTVRDLEAAARSGVSRLAGDFATSAGAAGGGAR